MNERVKSNHLRVTLIAGLILLVLSGTVLTFFYINERKANAITRQKDNFHRIMREFDAAFEDLYYTNAEFERLNGELDRMEKTAVTVESWLSILKRRRNLAKINPESAVHYKKTIANARSAYPSSQAIALLACAVSGGAEQSRGLLDIITDSSFNSARLYLHILSGDFENPQRASVIPADLVSDGTESVTVDLALIKILRRDYRGASSVIQVMLNEIGEDETQIPSSSALNFAAEYYYDFGSPLRSAEIFSYISGERAMLRQADALYIAGFPDSAAALWNILAGSRSESSLFNLALTADDSAKSSSYLERLVSAGADKMPDSPASAFGLILYSRLLNHTNAIALLQKKIDGKTPESAYIDLEICKRYAQYQNPGRHVAETWFLLDRREDNDDIRKWALWNMFFHRDYKEADILLNRMELQKHDSNWLKFYKALYLMNEGKLDEAEKILRSIPDEFSDWRVHVNLGRIFEAARSPRGALEQYQLALEKAGQTEAGGKTTSLLYLRIARCYTALNRPNDAFRSLQSALDYDPGNLKARLELEALSGSF